MKQKLEIAANIAVIVVAVVVCLFFLRSYLAKFRPDPGEIRVGDHLSSNLINWQRNNRTLVLAMKAGCEFCERSAPFYRKLLDEEKEGAVDAHLVAALPGDSISTRTFLTSEGLPSMDSISGVPLDSLKVKGTPTAILVNRDGQVMKVWVGLLTKDGEESLMKAIETRPVANSH